MSEDTKNENEEIKNQIDSGEDPNEQDEAIEESEGSKGISDLNSKGASGSVEKSGSSNKSKEQKVQSNSNSNEGEEEYEMDEYNNYGEDDYIDDQNYNYEEEEEYLGSRKGPSGPPVEVKEDDRQLKGKKEGDIIVIKDENELENLEEQITRIVESGKVSREAKRKQLDDKYLQERKNIVAERMKKYEEDKKKKEENAKNGVEEKKTKVIIEAYKNNYHYGDTIDKKNLPTEEELEKFHFEEYLPGKNEGEYDDIDMNALGFNTAVPDRYEIAYTIEEGERRYVYRVKRQLKLFEADNENNQNDDKKEAKNERDIIFNVLGKVEREDRCLYDAEEAEERKKEEAARKKKEEEEGYDSEEERNYQLELAKQSLDPKKIKKREFEENDRRDFDMMVRGHDEIKFVEQIFKFLRSETVDVFHIEDPERGKQEVIRCLNNLRLFNFNLVRELIKSLRKMNLEHQEDGLYILSNFLLNYYINDRHKKGEYSKIIDDALLGFMHYDDKLDDLRPLICNMLYSFKIKKEFIGQREWEKDTRKIRKENRKKEQENIKAKEDAKAKKQAEEAKKKIEEEDRIEKAKPTYLQKKIVLKDEEYQVKDLYKHPKVIQKELIKSVKERRDNSKYIRHDSDSEDEHFKDFFDKNGKVKLTEEEAKYQENFLNERLLEKTKFQYGKEIESLTISTNVDISPLEVGEYVTFHEFLITPESPLKYELTFVFPEERTVRSVARAVKLSNSDKPGEERYVICPFTRYKITSKSGNKVTLTALDELENVLNFLHEEGNGMKNVVSFYNYRTNDEERTKFNEIMEKYMEKALEVKVKIYGEGSTPSIEQVQALADFQRYTGQIDKASNSYLKAMRFVDVMMENTYKEAHKYYMELIDIYEKRKQYELVREYLERVLKLNIEAHSEFSPEVAEIYSRMAENYKREGIGGKAIYYYEKSYSVVNKAFEKSSADEIALIDEILEIYLNQKGDELSYEKVNHYFLEGLKVRRNIYPDGNKIVDDYIRKIRDWYFEAIFGNAEGKHIFCEKSKMYQEEEEKSGSQNEEKKGKEEETKKIDRNAGRYFERLFDEILASTEETEDEFRYREIYRIRRPIFALWREKRLIYLYDTYNRLYMYQFSFDKLNKNFKKNMDLKIKIYGLEIEDKYDEKTKKRIVSDPINKDIRYIIKYYEKVIRDKVFKEAFDYYKSILFTIRDEILGPVDLIAFWQNVEKHKNINYEDQLKELEKPMEADKEVEYIEKKLEEEPETKFRKSEEELDKEREAEAHEIMLHDMKLPNQLIRVDWLYHKIISVLKIEKNKKRRRRDRALENFNIMEMFTKDEHIFERGGWDEEMIKVGESIKKIREEMKGDLEAAKAKTVEFVKNYLTKENLRMDNDLKIHLALKLEIEKRAKDENHPEHKTYLKYYNSKKNYIIKQYNKIADNFTARRIYTKAEKYLRKALFEMKLKKETTEQELKEQNTRIYDLQILKMQDISNDEINSMLSYIDELNNRILILKTQTYIPQQGETDAETIKRAQENLKKNNEETIREIEKERTKVENLKGAKLQENIKRYLTILESKKRSPFFTIYEEIDYINRIADYCFQKKDYLRAFEVMDEARKVISKFYPDSLDEAKQHNRIGDYYKFTEQYMKAKEHYYFALYFNKKNLGEECNDADIENFNENDLKEEEENFRIKREQYEDMLLDKIDGDIDDEIAEQYSYATRVFKGKKNYYDKAIKYCNTGIQLRIGKTKEVIHSEKLEFQLQQAFTTLNDKYVFNDLASTDDDEKKDEAKKLLKDSMSKIVLKMEKQYVKQITKLGLGRKPDKVMKDEEKLKLFKEYLRLSQFCHDSEDQQSALDNYYRALLVKKDVDVKKFDSTNFDTIKKLCKKWKRQFLESFDSYEKSLLVKYSRFTKVDEEAEKRKELELKQKEKDDIEKEFNLMKKFFVHGVLSTQEKEEKDKQKQKELADGKEEVEKQEAEKINKPSNKSEFESKIDALDAKDREERLEREEINKKFDFIHDFAKKLNIEEEKIAEEEALKIKQKEEAMAIIYEQVQAKSKITNKLEKTREVKVIEDINEYCYNKLKQNLSLIRYHPEFGINSKVSMKSKFGYYLYKKKLYLESIQYFDEALEENIALYGHKSVEVAKEYENLKKVYRLLEKEVKSKFKGIYLNKKSLKEMNKCCYIPELLKISPRARNLDDPSKDKIQILEKYSKYAFFNNSYLLAIDTTRELIKLKEHFMNIRSWDEIQRGINETLKSSRIDFKSFLTGNEVDSSVVENALKDVEEIWVKIVNSKYDFQSVDHKITSYKHKKDFINQNEKVLSIFKKKYDYFRKRIQDTKAIQDARKEYEDLKVELDKPKYKEVIQDWKDAQLEVKKKKIEKCEKTLEETISEEKKNKKIIYSDLRAFYFYIREKAFKENSIKIEEYVKMIKDRQSYEESLNLFDMYTNKLKNTYEAKYYYRKMFERKEFLYGKADLEVADEAFNYATVLRILKDYSESIETYNLSLLLKIQAFKGENNYIAEQNKLIADAFHALPKYAKAYYDKYLQIKENNIKSNPHPCLGLADAYHRIANYHYFNEKFAVAQKYYLLSKQIKKEATDLGEPNEDNYYKICNFGKDLKGKYYPLKEAKISIINELVDSISNLKDPNYIERFLSVMNLVDEDQGDQIAYKVEIKTLVREIVARNFDRVDHRIKKYEKKKLRLKAAMENTKKSINPNIKKRKLRKTMNDNGEEERKRQERGAERVKIKEKWYVDRERRIAIAKFIDLFKQKRFSVYKFGDSFYEVDIVKVKIIQSMLHNIRRKLEKEYKDIDLIIDELNLDNKNNIAFSKYDAHENQLNWKYLYKNQERKKEIDEKIALLKSKISNKQNVNTEESKLYIKAKQEEIKSLEEEIHSMKVAQGDVFKKVEEFRKDAVSIYNDILRKRKDNVVEFVKEIKRKDDLLENEELQNELHEKLLRAELLFKEIFYREKYSTQDASNYKRNDLSIDNRSLGNCYFQKNSYFMSRFYYQESLIGPEEAKRVKNQRKLENSILLYRVPNVNYTFENDVEITDKHYEEVLKKQS